ISLFGQGTDAASMVEPYATMMEMLDVGRIVRRTGDVWSGAPGCSLTTTVAQRDEDPATVAAVVRGFVRATRFVAEHPAESAEIASRYIGVDARFIASALERNRPHPDAIRNQSAMDEILSLMVRLGYLERIPSGYADLSFLDACCTEHAAAGG